MFYQKTFYYVPTKILKIPAGMKLLIILDRNIYLFFFLTRIQLTQEQWHVQTVVSYFNQQNEFEFFAPLEYSSIFTSSRNPTSIRE